MVNEQAERPARRRGSPAGAGCRRCVEGVRCAVGGWGWHASGATAPGHLTEEIVTTARTALNEGQSISLRAIASEMGMATSALYRYIDSHADLQRLVATSVYRDVIASILAAAERYPPEASVEARFRCGVRLSPMGARASRRVPTRLHAVGGAGVRGLNRGRFKAHSGRADLRHRDAQAAGADGG